jgi:hypothetical protein
MVTATIILALCGVANTKTNEPAWVAKDWMQWSPYDCVYTLNNSPWVAQGRLATPSYFVSGHLSIIIRLRSALPICQALLRQIQIEKRYDKMNPQQKQVFDQQHADDLAEREDRDVVVEIINISVYEGPTGIRDSGYADQKAIAPRQVTLKLPDGSLISPTKTTVVRSGDHQNECQYAFPRIVNGKPLISANDSELAIMFGAPLTIDKKTKQVVPEAFQPVMPEPGTFFTISKLMYKGKLEY